MPHLESNSKIVQIFLSNFMFNNKLQTLQQKNMNHDEWATHKTRIKYLIP
jgi:hypothetical protein